MIRTWDKQKVNEILKRNFPEHKFVTVSNRQPYIHNLKKGKVVATRGPGGVITALDPVMKSLGGVWVCSGAGEADKLVAKNGKIKVPPKNPAYTLKYIWLTKQENIGYYYGFSNQALWPLSHLVFMKPVFRNQDWQIYKKVNKKYAKNISQQIKGKKAVVFIHDYHLSLVSKYLKQSDPQVKTIMFWHIPWPTYDIFRILPQRKEILKSMLSYDLIGFHIGYFGTNFLEAIASEVEAQVDKENDTVCYRGHISKVGGYPISIDFDGITEESKSREVQEMSKELAKEFNLEGYKIIIGLDRIDYTKGIIERIKAIDCLLDKQPELKGKIKFIQMGEVSRIHLPQYKKLNEEVNSLVEQVNFKHSKGHWRPITFVRRHLDFKEVLSFYQIADICIVSSLHDGMNLVAKEFVSSKFDLSGMLVLSHFTGASRQLDGALMVNPYHTEEFSKTIFKALFMKNKERQKRMKKLRESIYQDDIWNWIGNLISDLP